MTKAIIAQANDALDNPLNYPGLAERQDATVKFRVGIDHSYRATWSWTVFGYENTFYVRRIVWEPDSKPYNSPSIFGSESPIEASQFADMANQLASVRFPSCTLASNFGIDGARYRIEVREGETNCTDDARFTGDF